MVLVKKKDCLEKKLKINGFCSATCEKKMVLL